MANSFDEYVERTRKYSTSSTCSSGSSSVLTSSTDTPIVRRSVGSWRRDDSAHNSLELRTAQLLWNNRSVGHVWDVDFLADGTVVAITSKNGKVDAKVLTVHSKELRCFSPDGSSTSRVPFPGKFQEPGGIAVCRSTGSVAVTDGTGSGGTVTIFHKENNNWTRCATHDTNHVAFRLGLTDKHVPICAIRWEMLVKYTEGKRIWSKSISSSNELVPYLAIDDKGSLIVVSTPANDRVSVFSSKAELVSVFPTWFLKKPTGVCTDGHGRVYVADKANHSISQFTLHGRFIQKIVTMKEEPRCIRILDEKFLAVGTYFNGLFLYELEWEL